MMKVDEPKGGKAMKTMRDLSALIRRNASGRPAAGLLMILVVTVAAAGLRGEEQSLLLARSSLERAHTGQGELIQQLSDLVADRQRAAVAGELIGRLEAIYRMQSGLVENARALRAEMLREAAGESVPDLPTRIDDLARYQRSVRSELEDWQGLLSRHADGPGASQILKTLAARAGASPASSLMTTVVEQIEQRLVSNAATTAEEASDEIARLLQLLRSAVSDPDEVRTEQIRALQDLIVREQAIRSKLAGDDLARDAWRQLRREQAEVRERARLLTFEESGMAPNALEAVRMAYAAMQDVEAAALRQNQEQALAAADRALEALKSAVQTLEQAGIGEGMPEATDGPQMPQVPAKEGGGLPAVFGAGGEGLDESPIAMLAADIAAVARLIKAQEQLHAEARGDAPVGPVPGRRQLAYAAEIPGVARRVELYLEAVAGELEAARVAMVASGERWRADDKAGTLPHQEEALRHLRSSERQMRAFWEELMETLMRISSAVEGSPHGAEEDEEAAKEEMLMQLLRELVRIGRLIKTLDEVMARTSGWIHAPADAIDADAVLETARIQRELSQTGLDIFEKVLPLAEPAPSLPVAVMEASQWMEGAADMLDVPDFAAAHERQQVAMDFLENAWQVVAMSMAAMTEGERGDDDDPSEDPGEVEDREGEGGLLVGPGGERGTQPWYWELSPEAREVIEQSQAESLPPAYESAIKRYYQRLSGDREGGS